MQYFLWSLAAGVALALVYDILRLLRRIIPTCDIAVNIEDICFLLLSGGASVLIAYTINNGVLRLYALAATALGFVLYRMAVGSRLVDFFEYVYNLLSKLTMQIIGILLLPLRLIVRIMKKPLLITVSAAGRGVRRVRRKKETPTESE